MGNTQGHGVLNLSSHPVNIGLSWGGTTHNYENDVKPGEIFYRSAELICTVYCQTTPEIGTSTILYEGAKSAIGGILGAVILGSGAGAAYAGIEAAAAVVSTSAGAVGAASAGAAAGAGATATTAAGVGTTIAATSIAGPTAAVAAGTPGAFAAALGSASGVGTIGTAVGVGASSATNGFAASGGPLAMMGVGALTSKVEAYTEMMNCSGLGSGTWLVLLDGKTASDLVLRVSTPEEVMKQGKFTELSHNWFHKEKDPR